MTALTPDPAYATEVKMQGRVMINASALMALHDALVADDSMEAFHILRMQADPDCKVFLERRDHFAQWKALAALASRLPDREGWQTIESAPSACHVLATRFDECEWVYAVVESPPSYPFTHWQPLPAPPAG